MNIGGHRRPRGCSSHGHLRLAGRKKWIVVVAVTAGSVVAPTPAGALSSGSPHAGPSPSQFVPESADGCNQSVCIDVVGSGTTVSYWSTSTTLPYSLCTSSSYWANDVLVAKGPTQCGDVGSELSSAWNDPGYFPAGTQLCNTWSNISGRPCETIE